MAEYTCPVCCWPHLPDPPANWEICPCCGTEFENDDFFSTHEELRANWILDGYKWWSEATPAPDGWDARKQLEAGRG